MKLVPGTGSPPMPTQVVWPIPCWVISWSAWYVSVPGTAHDADGTAADAIARR